MGLDEAPFVYLQGRGGPAHVGNAFLPVFKGEAQDRHVEHILQLLFCF